MVLWDGAGGQTWHRKKCNLSLDMQTIENNGKQENARYSL